MKQPYPYQYDLIKRTSLSLIDNKQVIAHAPTGAGKSVIINEIANRTIHKNRTALVISETRKIYRQLVDECDGIEINANVKHLAIHEGRCYVAMMQTLQKRPLILEQFKRLGTNLVTMVDECHINIGGKVILSLKDAGCYVIGFTATPFYRFAPHLPIYYNDLIEGPQVDELIQGGYLCNYKHIARTRGEMSLLELRNGEFTERSNEKVFTAKQVYDGLFDDLRTIEFSKCVIFVASIKHADELKNKLIENGFSATSYHSKTENGSYELAKFTELNICNILVTIRSLSKGWDFKPIDLVVLNHATTSTCSYLQEIGRGSRIIKGVKERFTVLDYGDNYLRHGLYFEDRPYADLWNKKPKKGKKGEGVAPVTACPKCEAIIPASVRVCPYCNNELPITEKQLAEGQLVEITKHYTDLVGRRISTLTPQELAIYAKIKSKQAFAARVARALHQSNPAAGVLYEFAAAMGYKPSWADFQLRMIPATKIDFADITLR